MSNTIQENFRRATTRLDAVICASSRKLTRAGAKKAEWGIISEVLDKWVGIVESANERQLHWSENLIPLWTSTLRSRPWLTQPVFDIVDQKFSMCANKIAVMVPFSAITDLGFDDASEEEDDDGEDDEAEEDEAPPTNPNSKAKSLRYTRDLPVFKPNIHKLNKPRCNRCNQTNPPRMCFSVKSPGTKCERCIHDRQTCSLRRKGRATAQQGVVAKSRADSGKAKRKATADVETRKVRPRLSNSSSSAVDNVDTPRAGTSSHRRKTPALLSETDMLRNDLRILIGGVAMVGKMLNKHIAELEALADGRFGDELEGRWSLKTK